jgi:hypothetical protein
MGVDHLHRATADFHLALLLFHHPLRDRRISFFLKALCENPFSTNRTKELMGCKHNERTGLKILSYTSEYVRQLFFKPRNG